MKDTDQDKLLQTAARIAVQPAMQTKKKILGGNVFLSHQNMHGKIQIKHIIRTLMAY